jgi:hypothetical protein
MSEFYCDACYNTGELDCYCGGDLCICDRNGTYECPHCEGGRRGSDYPDQDEYPDYGDAAPVKGASKP